jgi:GNAT superfamily N-acetyltransferase
LILETNYHEILEIWKTYLWTNRVSKVESHSAMLMDGTYDLKNFNYKATYFLCIENSKIAGCNSGHRCIDNSYRSRGLFVFPEFRQQGIGTKLLQKTIDQGLKEKCSYVWSYPRENSWKTYEKAGFKLHSDWHQGENEINAFCIKYL